MASVTRKPQASRRAERRAEIETALLEATESLMHEGLAFTELSVDRLATAAGISRATFYVYFADKGDLLRALTAQVFTELSDGAHQWWDVADQHDVGDVRRSMRAIVDAFVRHRAVLTAVVEMAAYDRDVSSTYRLLMDGVVASAEPVIARALGTEGSQAHHVSSALAWMVERTCHQTFGAEAEASSAEVADAVADALTEIVWRTLYLRPAADG